MLNKILSFIVNEDNQILLLRNNPVDPIHGGDFWYTVTGGFEDYDKSGEDVVKREVKEETNLDVKEVFYLNWIFKYVDKNLECTEYAYISFVTNDEVKLDKTENIDYKWCDLDEFVKNIRWFGNLKVLKKVLSAGIERKKFFLIEKTEKFEFNFEEILKNNKEV